MFFLIIILIVFFLFLFHHRYRGAAHHNCNLQYRILPQMWKLPVLFHNLQGYDSHLIVKALKKDHGRVRAIPTNLQRFLTIGQLNFIDSFQFMSKPISELTGNLATSELHHTPAAFPNEHQFELVQQKGIYPYN